MKPSKFIKVLIISIILSCFTCVTVFAGTYTIQETIQGIFSQQYVAIRNKAGVTIQVHPYEFSPRISNVKSINGYYRSNNIFNIDIDIYYSTDGMNFIYGTRIENTQFGPLYSYTISIGSIPKTVAAIAFIPKSLYDVGIQYLISSPTFSRVMTDNTSPDIALSEQTEFSRDSVTITA